MNRKYTLTEITSNLNKVRVDNLNVPLSYSELSDLIGSTGVPYQRRFITYLLKGCIKRDGHVYFFGSSPIHIKRVEAIIKELRKYYIDRLKTKKTTYVNEIPSVEMSETECINFLKSKGYIILRSV